MEEEIYQFEPEDSPDAMEGVQLHSGFPNPRHDSAPTSLDFNQRLVRHPAATFVFRIQGNDWHSLGVWPDDLAIVDRLLDPRAEDIVVWCQEGEPSFHISRLDSIPSGAVVWGVISAIIHEYRKEPSHA